MERSKKEFNTMPQPVHVSIVPKGIQLDPSELTRVAAAINQQVQRDFGPIWKVHASVDAFTHLEDVPVESWPIFIASKVDGAAGVHEDQHGQPFALVEMAADWSLTASHEALEMLADPFGRRLHAGPTLQQAVRLGVPQHRVRYLIEVCDPSEAAAFAYHTGGVLVSDFYTPAFFNPVTTPGVRYSFSGAIKTPLTVLPGGYISWHDMVSDHWMQFRNFPDDQSSKPHVVDLSNNQVFSDLRQRTSLRAAVDRVTHTPKLNATFKGAIARSLKVRVDSGRKAQRARAAFFEESIGTLTGS